MRQTIRGNSLGRLHVLMTLVVLSLAPTTLHAWGSMGHRIVAEVAQRHLEPRIAHRLYTALGHRRLPELATWPDDIRSDPAWSCAGPFHYITVPDGAEYFEYNAGLSGDDRPKGDALRALVYFETVLGDDSTTPAEMEKALSFLIHLVGDLHQPLHNGRGCDRGGNSVNVNYFGEAVNLHTVWDEKLIESERLSFTEFATFIDHLPKAEIVTLQSHSPMVWVDESRSRLDAIYTCDASPGGDRCTCFCGQCPTGESVFGGCRAVSCAPVQAGPINLKYGYKARSIGPLKEQLVKGGVRLAGLLNRTLANSSPEQYPGYQSYEAFRTQIEGMRDWRGPIRQCMKSNQPR